MQVERYDVRVNGAGTDAVALRRLGALAFTLTLVETAPSSVESISIFEHETGAARACWRREHGSWHVVAVQGWLS